MAVVVRLHTDMAGKRNFDGEIKSAMKEKESSAEEKADKRQGITEGSKQDVGMHAMPGARGAARGDPVHMAKMQHAAGIAHAILGGRKVM
jgi:hypothetical protein